MPNIIETKNLSISYKEQKVLKNLNVQLKKNKITAIIGPSGCGKTTFLKALNMLLVEEKDAVIEGDILFHGHRISEFAKETIRQRIGMVFQKPTSFPFSIYKNLEYALKYYGVKKEKRQEMIIEKLKITGLYEEVKDLLHKNARKLSGGQQQRLCIARALTIEPEVLLLDEPCSSLDVKNTMNIEKLLISLKQKYTIVIVTHNLSQAKRIADETLFMLDGETIEFDNTNKIFEKPTDQRTKEYVFGQFG